MDFLRSSSFRAYLTPATLFLSLLTLYLLTLAPGLTWAHAGSDGGDLIAATATGGVAHPTGYPLYLLLARLFQVLPLGSLAYRTNLMSAFFMALAAVLVYELVVRVLLAEVGVAHRLAGLAAGYAFGLAPLVWSQALITEVYALHAFLITLVLYVYATPHLISTWGKRRLDRWRGFLLGLATSNHITFLFLALPALIVGSISWKSEAENRSGKARRWDDALGFDRRTFQRQSAWFGLGLSLYVILPLRAFGMPPVNWGNPITPGRFWWLVSGQLYQSYYLSDSLSGAGERIQAWAAILVEQFGIPGIILGALGLVLFGNISRFSLLTAWTAFIFSLFAMIYHTNDSSVYLIPVFISFALWIGTGAYGLARSVSGQYPSLRLISGIVIVAYFFHSAGNNLRRVDASQDMRAENFAYEVLSTAPEHALVFADGDQAVFALWYFHFAVEQRSDLVVLASDLLHFDWYRESLHSTYPSLVLPDPLPYPETITIANPTRPVCYVQYTDRSEIACTNPMTTP